jgi:processive 1,2-diacylglycerol beta-glucosyltransferase
MTPPTSQRILLLAASLGSGHLRAAAAVEGALRALDPACFVAVLDIKPLISPWLRFLQFHGYEFLIEHAPRGWRLLYQSPFMRGIKYAAPKFLLQHGNRQLVERMRAFAPDVIVSTQINCHELAYFISSQLLSVPRRISVVTDYDVHPIWSKTPADLIVVGHEDLAKKLVGLSVDPSRVAATGIPIDLKFKLPLDRSALCERFGLRPEIKTILVMGGSVGFGEIDRVVEDLLKSEQPVHILAVAGRNEAVRQRLEFLQRKISVPPATHVGSRLHVFGHVDSIHELMTVADCFITKPGGLATTEALVKQLPMLFVNPIAGHEEQNAKFFVEHGAALEVKKIAQLRPALDSLFEGQSRKIRAMKAAMPALAKPDAALTLAERILG